MRPIFTIHAGEYLVANELEHKYPDLRVWVPSKDTGIDLLVTDKSGQKVASLQVKFSKDHLATGREKKATPKIKSGGWWSFKAEKIESSQADYWVLVLSESISRNFDYLIISPKKLLEIYRKIGKENATTIQTYFWVTNARKCWETRGLGQDELVRVCEGNFESKDRDFSQYLNEWPFERA